MAGVWIVLVGMAFGGLALVAVAFAVAQPTARAGATPTRRGVAFTALVATGVLALNGAMELGGVFGVLLALAFVASLVQAGRVVLAARRDGQPLARYALVTLVVVALEVAGYHREIGWALEGEPPAELDAEGDESWRVEGTLRAEE